MSDTFASEPSHQPAATDTAPEGTQPADTRPAPPAPVTPVTVVATEPAQQRPSRAGWFVAAALAIVAGVFAFLWSSTAKDLDTVRAERDTITAERDTITAERDTITAERDELAAAAAAAQAEADALPDVFATINDAVGDLSGFDVTGDETYASISVTGDGIFYMDSLVAALVELGFPAGIEARIGNTRALDGTLTADGDKVRASWSYHPDDGLSMVVEHDT